MEDNVGKLDDVVYATQNSVHAYQLKYSKTEAQMAYSAFRDLIGDIVEGWRRLKKTYVDKTVYPCHFSAPACRKCSPAVHLCTSPLPACTRTFTRRKHAAHSRTLSRKTRGSHPAAPIIYSIFNFSFLYINIVGVLILRMYENIPSGPGSCSYCWSQIRTRPSMYRFFPSQFGLFLIPGDPSDGRSPVVHSYVVWLFK